MDRKTASDEIAAFTAGLSREQFDQQRGTQLIVERLIITVGEALSRAERTVENLDTLIPELWDIAGMRHRIVHGYRDIDEDIVWNVVVTKAPELAMFLRNLLAEQAPPLSERRVQGG